MTFFLININYVSVVEILQNILIYNQYVRKYAENSSSTFSLFKSTFYKPLCNFYVFPGRMPYRGNAFYDFRGNDERIQHVLCFFPVDFDGSRYTSQYFDVLSHEGGHFVLNILRPDLWHSESPDIQAFHETFGDITALFAVLSFPELRRMLLTKTNGNLHVSSFLSVIGEGVTDRDTSQCTRLTQPPSCEEHELSEKLTHALYGILADFVNAERIDEDEDFEPIKGDKDSLFVQAIEKFQSYFLIATVKSKLTSFVDFGRTLRQSNNLFFNHLVHLNFLRQQIDLTDHKLSPQLCLLPKENDQKQFETMGCATGKVGIRKHTRGLLGE